MSSSYFSTHRWWHSAVSQVCFQVQSCLVIARPPNTCHLYLRLSLHPLLFVSSQFPSLCWNEKYSSNIGEQNWTLASSVWHRKKTKLLSDLDCLLLFFTCTLYEIVSILTLSFAVERDINVFWKYLTQYTYDLQHTISLSYTHSPLWRWFDAAKMWQNENPGARYNFLAGLTYSWDSSNSPFCAGALVSSRSSCNMWRTAF